MFRSSPAHTASAREAALAVGTELAPTERTDDLVAASRLLSDDLVVMTREVSGNWQTTALTLTAPTFFAIDHAFGRDLTALHAAVPEGAQLADRIGRVFDGLQPGQILERFNWTLQAGDERFTPSGAPLKARAQAASTREALELLHLRVERQTICKLPETGAILFTIRVCLDPLRAIEPADRPLLADAWRSLGDVGRAYKGWGAYERLVQAAFKSWGV